MAMLKYCDRCGGLREQTHRHKVDRTVGQRGRRYDAEWARTSQDFRDYYPICQWHEGCIKPSAQVHHRDGNPDGPKRHDWGNLQALCREHHARITAEMQPGGWNHPDYVREW